jgi:mRNA interferase YafQ
METQPMIEYKYKPVETSLFKRTKNLAEKRGFDLSLLEEPIILLAKGEQLPPKYHDHQLKGKLSAFRECHIKGDWLLIYRIIESKLILSLHSTGTHSDLFE